MKQKSKLDERAAQWFSNELSDEELKLNRSVFNFFTITNIPY